MEGSGRQRLTCLKAAFDPCADQLPRQLTVAGAFSTGIIAAVGRDRPAGRRGPGWARRSRLRGPNREHGAAVSGWQQQLVSPSWRFWTTHRPRSQRACSPPSPRCRRSAPRSRPPAAPGGPRAIRGDQGHLMRGGAHRITIRGDQGHVMLGGAHRITIRGDQGHRVGL